MKLIEGKDEHSDMTFDCDDQSCLYIKNNRCIYNVARIKQRVARACYQELLQDEIECRNDREDGGG